MFHLIFPNISLHRPSNLLRESMAQILAEVSQKLLMKCHKNSG